MVEYILAGQNKILALIIQSKNQGQKNYNVRF